VNGDFDLNGTINFDDYAVIDLAFNTQTGAIGSRVIEGGAIGGGAVVRGGTFASATPEPAASLACLLGVTAMSVRRRPRMRRR